MASSYNSFNGLYAPAELNRIRRYLREELKRSMLSFKNGSRPSVFYLAYLFRNQRTERIWGRLGAINKHRISSTNTVFCDLRVGSYRYDNLSNGGLSDNSDKDESIDYIFMPAEIGQDAFKFSLWKLTDARYREAVEQYFEKKSKELHFVDPNRKLPARIRQKRLHSWKNKSMEEIDADYWKYLIKRAGNLIKKYHRIKNSWFEFTGRQSQRILISSEGREILEHHSVYELRAHIWMLSSKGEGIAQDLNFIEGDPTSLPNENEFLRLIKKRIDMLLNLEKAPALNSYSGPVMLSPEACGVFFHEVVGHRLEGSRLLAPDEGATFRDLRGKKIAPDYIDIIDDPSLNSVGNRRMIGHFQYDDEGTSSSRAVLVEKGILRNFLTTTMPIPGQKEINGHARNQRYERPISRMGNLFVFNREPISREEMRERFIAEIKRQKKPYGIHVKEVVGGETDTSSYDFQAFKGEIMHAVRVYPNGKEEAIRGVDFVGTPLSALDSVECLGDDMEMDNSYCGAESGIVPVSTVAPSMLMRNLELQSRANERLTQYILPLPFEHANPRKKKKKK